MLMEFKAENYKSFKNEFVFSMIPAPKQKGLDYSILQEKIENKTYKGLSSSVIYGANASGKTNIIGAMEVFKYIILRGNIKNIQDNSTPNLAINTLELIPNINTDINEPVGFSIKFIEENLLIEYKISVNAGQFYQTDFKRELLSEELYVNENLIFARDTETINFKQLKSIEKYLINNFKENKNNLINIAQQNINSQELFLTNGFKTMFSQKIVEIITDWLINKFKTIFMANALFMSPKYDREKIKLYKDDNYTNIAKIIGGINDIAYTTYNNKSEPEMVSILKLFNDSKTIILSRFFESYGTFRFLNMFPVIAEVLKNGGTLIMDEFDASLHPMLVMNIINIFHNDNININKAQLIFNTHNPIFLNSNLFRRDEIKFVERSDETHLSELYSLSDFGTDGKDGVRKSEDYMRNYFIYKYGAIKDIDFSPIFEKLLNIEEKIE